jgi:hypothetical protein
MAGLLHDAGNLDRPSATQCTPYISQHFHGRVGPSDTFISA